MKFTEESGQMKFTEEYSPKKVDPLFKGEIDLPELKPILRLNKSYINYKK